MGQRYNVHPIQRNPNQIPMACGGKRIVSIIDRLSASLLEVKEEAFVIVLLKMRLYQREREGERSPVLLVSIIFTQLGGKRNDPKPSKTKQTSPKHFKMSPKTTTPDPLASSQFIILGLVDKSWVGFSVSAGGFIMCKPLGGHWGWLTFRKQSL